MRVYILSASDELAALSDYGPGWERMWVDTEGKRLLPFRHPPDGYDVLTLEEARAYMAANTPIDPEFV